MTRTHAPVFWLLFGAGGMLSALIGGALVFVTGLAVPLGWPLPSDALAYPRVLALAQHPLGKASLFSVIALFAWHAAHRLLCTVHDFGLRKGPLAKGIAYGGALVVTLVTAAALARL